MKMIQPLFVVMLLVAGVLTGCQSPPARTPVESGASLRNNSYSLLHQLLDEQKDVSLLRFIKSERSDVKILVKRIAAPGAQPCRNFSIGLHPIGRFISTI
jgi:hypothetical protein